MRILSTPWLAIQLTLVRLPLAETNETSSDPSNELMASMLPLDHLVGSLPVGLCAAKAPIDAESMGASNEVIVHCLDGGVLYRLRPGAVGSGTGIDAASIIELPEAFHGGKVNRMPWMNAFTNRMRRVRPPVQLVPGEGGALICFRSGEPSLLFVQLDPAQARANDPNTLTQEGQRTTSVVSGATAHLISLPEELVSQGAVVVGARALPAHPTPSDTTEADGTVRSGCCRGFSGLWYCLLPDCSLPLLRSLADPGDDSPYRRCYLTCSSRCPSPAVR